MVEDGGVDGLEEAHVVEGGLEVGPLSPHLGDGVGGHIAYGANGEDGYVAALSHRPPLAHGYLLHLAVPVLQASASARIADDKDAVPGYLSRVHQRAQFVLVIGRGHRDAGDGTQVSQVKSPVMGGAVVPHEAGAVQTDAHVEPQNGAVVDDVVVGPLGEGGVDVTEGHHAVLGQSGRECDGVALGDTYVEDPVGHLLLHDAHRAARRHGRRDAEDARVGARQLQQRIAEHVLIARALAVGVLRDDLPRLLVEATGVVPRRRLQFRRAIALALDRVHVQELGPLHILDLRERLDQFYHVVAVHGTEVADIEALEDVLLIGQQGLERVVEPDKAVLARVVEEAELHELLRELEAQFVVSCRGVQMAQILPHAAHTAVYAHAVVVDDDEHVVGRGGHVVEPFERESAAHRPVAYDGHDMTRCLALALGGDGHAESGRDRVGGVAAGKRVVLALLGRGEREQPVVLPVGIKTAAAAREYLVGIGLMAHIPYQTVVWSLEDIVESHSELHHSEARGKVTGIVRQTVYKVSSELVA